MRRALILSLALAVAPLAAPAQDTAEADRGFVVGFLEDKLSGAGREVRIEGFAGALSSRATFDRMTIADGAGVWITLTDGAIQWNRGALLRGRVDVAELSAAEIDLDRLPQSETGPEARATGFALPDLPVSVEIGKISAAKVVLAAPVLGQPAEVAIDGKMTLGGGEGSASLSLRRTDGAVGEVTLDAGFANATRQLSLDLLVKEGAGGIAASLLDLPGAPALTLAAHGIAPIDQFDADIALTTDGKPRLAGRVTLTTTQVEGAASDHGFRAALSGDILPLVAPAYQDFFGPEVSLAVAGRRAGDGTLELSELALGARGMTLTGSAALAADGLPQRFDLTAELGLEDRTELAVPVAGGAVVRAGTVKLAYDAARGEDWTLDARLFGVRRGAMAVQGLRLTGTGRIARAGGGQATGQLHLSATGIDPGRADLAAAVGPFVAGKFAFDWQKGAPLRLTDLALIGRDQALSGSAEVSAVAGDLRLSGALEARLRDLSRLSGLAGRPLGGAGTARVSGWVEPVKGAFDGTATLAGTDLATGTAELDRLLAGQSTVSAKLRRSAEGLFLDEIALQARTLALQGQGVLRTGASDVTATLEFSDLSVLGASYRGALSARAALREEGGVQSYTLTGTGQDLALGQTSVDRVLRGATLIDLAATRRAGALTLDRLTVENPQIQASASGTPAQIDLSARLANAAILLPDFPGPVEVKGRIADQSGRYDIALSGTGPGGTQAKVSGSYGVGRADLAISGRAQAALANVLMHSTQIEGPLAFDLRLVGPLALNSLSGRVTLSGGRIASPSVGLALQDVAAAADLSAGRATLSAEAGVAGGGRLRVAGPITLRAPFDATLDIGVQAARLRDPELFDTTLTGDLTLRGPLAGGAQIAGALRLGETELRVPSSGFGPGADLPGLRHLGDSAAVRDTRRKAGLDGPATTGGRSVGRPYGLDIALSAPNRVFVRGRGLDAELGGALRLRGTTADIRPEGRFDLIRGRLDILGKRLTLTRGEVTLQGALVPAILFEATTATDTATVTVRIEGDATAPVITFASSPELPEEEVLAQLLFGRGLQTLSPLQAAQLAGAVATLAGRGGEGIVGRLRKGFGLDDLDLTTDATGGASLRAGKYLSENLYTDIQINADGTSQINLNLDITDTLTGRGRLGSDGETGIGVYYEKDY